VAAVVGTAALCGGIWAAAVRGAPPHSPPRARPRRAPAGAPGPRSLAGAGPRQDRFLHQHQPRAAHAANPHYGPGR
nr:hypothetical protein [Tanacetum cinerariifolium]